MTYRLHSRVIFLSFIMSLNIIFAKAQTFGNTGPEILETFVETTLGCRVWVSHVQHELVAKWSGDCVDGYVSGTGTLDMQSLGKSDRYEGAMSKGKPEGSGIIKFSDGRTLSGEFHNGHVSGVADYVIPSGLHYKGEWSDGVEEGRGVAVFPSGNQYSGMWHNGQMDGYGVMTSPSGTTHEGVFRNGRPNGHGITSKPDGYRIEGEWVKGILNGHGSYSSVHGAHYDGDFKNGNPEGVGNYTADSGDTYQGSWNHGVPDGQGTVTRKNNVFSGKWKNGCLLLDKRFISVIVDPESCEKTP